MQMLFFRNIMLLAGVVSYGMTAKAEPIVGQAVHNVSSREMFSWFWGLILVLSLFFLCIWLLRRAGSFVPLNSAARMRIMSVVALGMREKVVLLSVGNKQLVLAVTPGRIETLATLEGDACLVERDSSAVNEQNFAQKLMQVLQGKSDV